VVGKAAAATSENGDGGGGTEQPCCPESRAPRTCNGRVDGMGQFRGCNGPKAQISNVAQDCATLSCFRFVSPKDRGNKWNIFDLSSCFMHFFLFLLGQNSKTYELKMKNISHFKLIVEI
jgi:hypothetical protein